MVRLLEMMNYVSIKKHELTLSNDDEQGAKCSKEKKKNVAVASYKKKQNK